MSGLIDAAIARFKASAYGVLSRVVAYVSGVIALVFILAGAFIWIAREESLVFACFVFAAAFVIIGVAGLLSAFLFRRRADRLASSKADIGLAMLQNPALARAGLHLAGAVRRSPKITLGLALIAGVVLSLVNQRGAARQSEQA